MHHFRGEAWNPKNAGPTRIRTFRPGPTRALRSKTRPDPSPKKRGLYPPLSRSSRKITECTKKIFFLSNNSFLGKGEWNEPPPCTLLDWSSSSRLLCFPSFVGVSTDQHQHPCVQFVLSMFPSILLCTNASATWLRIESLHSNMFISWIVYFVKKWCWG